MILKLVVLTVLIIIIIVMYCLKFIKPLDKDIIRFILTGGFNTFNYYLCYLFLIDHIVYIESHLIAFIYSAFISFFITSIYTFKEKVTFQKFILFPTTFLPNLIISTLMTYVFVNYNILSENISSLIAMFMAIPITYLMSKLIIKEKKDHN